MSRLIALMCWMVLGAGLAPVLAQPARDDQTPQGTWTAT